MKQLTLLIILTITSLLPNESLGQELSRFPGIFGFGHYRDNVKISKKEFKLLISQSETANAYWKKGSRHKIYSYISLIGFVGFTEWALRSNHNNNEILILPLIGIALSYSVGLGFQLSSNSLQKKSILQYNEEVTPKSMSQNIKFGIAPNGIGFVMGL